MCVLDLRKSVALIVCLVIAACTTTSGKPWPNNAKVSPDQAPKPATVSINSNLVLTIDIEKNAFQLGEPIYMVLRLENTGSAPIRVMGELWPEDGAVSVHILRPKGDRRDYIPLVELDYDTSAIKELAPNQKIGAVFPIFFDATGWVFNDIGEYRVSASYRTRGDSEIFYEAQSQHIPISVTASSDGSGEFLLTSSDQASIEAGKFLTWQAGDHLDLGREKLKQLIERWPDSILASYSQFAFGKSLSQPFMDYRKNSVREANCELALEYLNRVKTTHLSHNSELQRELANFRCKAKQGEGKEAISSLKRMRDSMGERPEYQSFGEILSDHEKNMQ